MAEYCYQSTTKTKNITKLNMILSLILSNPLYFLYLIFFSPYIFKLLSFLSPLFLTTSLIFFSLLTTLFPVYSKDTFFLTVYNTLLHFQDGMSLPSIALEELEVYKILFEISTIDQNPIHNEAFQEYPFDEKVELTSSDGNSNGKCESLTMEELEKVCTIPKEVKVEENQQEVVIKEESIIKRWESNVIEGYKTTKYIPRKIYRYVEGKIHVVSPVSLENCKIVFKKLSAREGAEEEEEKVVVKEVIKRWESNVIEGYYSPKKEANFGEAFSPSFGSSMRKEKEWRRTLACKLFEERHNTNIKNNKDNNTSVNEGMDLLWETYEVESIKGKSKEKESKRGRKKDSNRFEESMKMQNMKHDDDSKGRKKDTRIEELLNMENGDDHEDEDDVDDNVNGKLCCLQALKLSAGKMNLSMGMRFSKAFKGIGFTQSHARKEGKKGYK